MYQETNDFGIITINKSYFIDLIKDILKPYEGSVWTANYAMHKQDVLFLFGVYDTAIDFDFRTSENGAYFKVYLICKLGVSISQVAKDLINNLSSFITNELCMEIDNIIVELTAVQTSKGLKSRISTYSYNDKK